MTTDTPSSNDKVSSPLHLLQTLTRTLNEHLAEACSTAEKDARKAHEKLLRQQEKLELKLRQAEEKLANRTAEDPDKTRRKLADLQAALDELKTARDSAESYIKQLEADVRQTLRLAKGLERIDAQVGQALEKRDAPKPAAKPRSRRAPARRKPATRKPAPAASEG